MSRVITFSRYFPKGHPRAGEPTYFVEKLWASFDDFLPIKEIFALPCNVYEQLGIDSKMICTEEKKHHTIRAGNHWKIGDKFSPRVWSGKPYASKQITIAPDIEIKKIWNFIVTGEGYFLNDNRLRFLSDIEKVAKNDGLAADDFECWFALKQNQIFTGQILCWNEAIDY